jgi:hypothetical protein
MTCAGDPVLRQICRFLGHRFAGSWGDNGCYTDHESGEPGADEHWHLFTRFCGRCSQMQSKLEAK